MSVSWAVMTVILLYLNVSTEWEVLSVCAGVDSTSVQMMVAFVSDVVVVSFNV